VVDAYLGVVQAGHGYAVEARSGPNPLLRGAGVGVVVGVGGV
jgi:hypothetical protein